MIVKFYTLLVLVFGYLLILSCRDSGPDDSNPPIPQDSCIVYEPILDSISKVRVYTVKDTTAGFGYATKVNSISFFNFGAGKSPEGIDIHLFSNDQNGGLTDYIILYVDNTNKGCYTIKTDCYRPKPKVTLCTCAYFDNWDRDIIVDEFIFDTNRIDNKIEIIKIDTIKKLIEGRFSCSFVFANDRPKRDPLNLDTMRFFNGYFKGKYKDR